MTKVDIRHATPRDRDAIQAVHLSAFPDGECAPVAKLAIDLLSEQTTPRTRSLVAEADGAIVGHTAFSPVRIDGDEDFQGYILAPLGVKPEHQKRRIGSALIEYGLQQLSATGVNAVFVYGDPDYYGRFGFSADAACDFNAPYRLQYPFGWQAIILRAHAVENAPATITCVTALRDPELW